VSDPVPEKLTTWAAKSQSRLVEAVRTTIVPLLLMLITPPTAIALWIACRYLDGEISRLPTAEGWAALAAHWPWPTLTAAELIGGFVLLQLVLLRLLPGPIHFGPVTPMGNRPRYRLNGVAAYLTTHALLLGTSFGLGWLRLGMVWDHFGAILATLVLFALALCVLLYLMGTRWPSSTDHSRSGNVIWDFFWGTELHPTLGGLNLKQLVNCRVSMTGWSVIVVCFAAKQLELYGTLSSSLLVCVALQWIYLLKFFRWESGYFGSLDIMHDRFGYYICWGVLSWVPAVYAIAAQYLTTHPIELPRWYAGLCFALGVAAIWLNYDADAQRQRTRATAGKTTVWGKAPELIHAEYRTGDGAMHSSLLLVSGWWGVARHFHYLPEIALALAWSLPALFGSFVPYFYVVFLTILLATRAGRDDRRCQRKYGVYWDQYRARVRWKILPGIY
jgi:7-dehydrocholesterol reductase